ncbi:hypothetical protein BDD12DRAFT_823773 [Trichophaea hybrida]|nr:hypothetical protein BDD12DRAFT_823773 [Trichophaea hybrida]
MSHLRRNVVPNAWDDDDWTAPSTSKLTPTATPFTPDSPIIVAPATQQPKTFYKPELTILKRASNSSPSKTPSSSGTSSSTRNEEKERKEKERKEKERRYQEAKDRIFASGAGATEKKTAKKKCGSGKNSGQNTPKKSSSPPPQPRSSGTNSPARSTPKPQSTGAITGFSLNSGSLSAAPVKIRERQKWQLRQVALDGKMLESQAEAYGFGRDEELLGDKERGLDWDEFRRDRWSGGREGGWEGEVVLDELEGRLDKLDFVEFGESAEEPGSRRIDGVVLPVREPRGPDEEGKGFAGRGRGGRARGGFGAS